MPSDYQLLGLFDHAGVSYADRKLDRYHRVPGPYRVDLINEYGVGLHTVRRAQSRLHLKIRDVVEHRTGVPSDLAVRGLPLATKVDAALAIFEDKVILPAHLRRTRHSPYSSIKLAVVSCWWAEEIAKGSDEDRARIRRITGSLDEIFVFSSNQIEIFEQVGAAHKVKPVPFGVDHHHFVPTNLPTEHGTVVSAGVDRGRDFDSLIQAARQLDDVKFQIYTQPGRVNRSTLPRNVQLMSPVSGDAYRDALSRAEMVVVPTHDLAYPTGQSVLLEAMSSGKPTMVTDTAAMREYIGADEFNLSMPLHDPQGIADCIRRALSDSEHLRTIGTRARHEVKRNFNFNRTWSEVAQHLKQT